MTHNETLEKIEKREADMCSLTVMDDDKCQPIHEIYDALRAVVELAKQEGDTGHSGHDEGWNIAMRHIMHAIEKELK